MDRRVNTELITKWIDNHSPSGAFRLGEESGVSAWTIVKVRTGYVPKKAGTRRLLAHALGVTEDKLFPLVRAGGKAS